MSKKEDAISKLIDETKERLKDEKTLGLVAGAVVGYMLSDKIESRPKVRNAILTAVGGETIARLLGDSKDGGE